MGRARLAAMSEGQARGGSRAGLPLPKGGGAGKDGRGFGKLTLLLVLPFEPRTEGLCVTCGRPSTEDIDTGRVFAEISRAITLDLYHTLDPSALRPVGLLRVQDGLDTGERCLAALPTPEEATPEY